MEKLKSCQIWIHWMAAFMYTLMLGQTGVFRWEEHNDMYIYIIYDEGVLGSDMGVFLIGGHWPKILPQNLTKLKGCS